jgi:4-hydroxy-tetrahydrodipicolinate synthase
MSILGMPSGMCRPPLGKMTLNGLNTVLDAARKVYTDSPEILQPVAEFFNVDIGERLAKPSYRKGLCYESY